MGVEGPVGCVPAAEEDVLGLLDDLLQQPLVLLQRRDLRLVVGHRPGQALALVAEGGAGGVRHHHRAELLLVELEEQEEPCVFSFSNKNHGKLFVNIYS